MQKMIPKLIWMKSPDPYLPCTNSESPNCVPQTLGRDHLRLKEGVSINTVNTASANTVSNNAFSPLHPLLAIKCHSSYRAWWNSQGHTVDCQDLGVYDCDCKQLEPTIKIENICFPLIMLTTHTFLKAKLVSFSQLLYPTPCVCIGRSRTMSQKLLQTAERGRRCIKATLEMDSN